MADKPLPSAQVDVHDTSAAVTTAELTMPDAEVRAAVEQLQAGENQDEGQPFMEMLAKMREAAPGLVDLRPASNGPSIGDMFIGVMRALPSAEEMRASVEAVDSHMKTQSIPEPPAPGPEDEQLTKDLVLRLKEGDYTAVELFKTVRRRKLEYELHNEVKSIMAVSRTPSVAAFVDQLRAMMQPSPPEGTNLGGSTGSLVVDAVD